MALELINYRYYELKKHSHSYKNSAIILIVSLIMVLPGAVAGARDLAIPTLHAQPQPFADLFDNWHGSCAGCLPSAGWCPLQQLPGAAGDHRCGGDRGSGTLRNHCHHDKGKDQAGEALGGSADVLGKSHLVSSSLRSTNGQP